MQKLYLDCYFNEMEDENDADVFVMDDKENQTDAFKKFFKETYDYEIEDKDIRGIYPIENVSSSSKFKYRIDLKKIS